MPPAIGARFVKVILVTVSHLPKEVILVVVWTCTVAPTVPPILIFGRPLVTIIVKKGGTPQKLAAELVGRAVVLMLVPPLPEITVEVPPVLT